MRDGICEGGVGAPPHRSTRATGEHLIAAGDELLKGSLRRARSSARALRIDDYVTEFDKHLLGGTDTVKACSRILRSLHEKFARGASQHALEEFWLLGLAITRAWFAEQQRDAIDPNDPVAVRAELSRLHLAEEEAQGAREAAEIAYAYDQSPANAERLLTAQAAYVVADAALIDFVRTMHVRREFRLLRRRGVTVHATGSRPVPVR